MKLRLSDALSLPVDEAVTQTVGILAMKRAGKSYTARRFAEQLLQAGQQIVIVDPKGDWWGIRSSADGKRPGFPVVIIGGEHADVPLEVSGGELVAKLVVEERVNLLIDLSLPRKHEVATFMTAFLETLYRLKAHERYRTPVMLIIDEADAIASQKPAPNEARMLGAAEDIVRRGGQRGIGCTLITQRSAVLNKNVLTQVQLLITLRTIAPQDLSAMNAWIDVHGTQEQRRTLMESLPSLPRGDAWFWSPGWPTDRGIFCRTRVLPIETFDSGATPKPGEKRIEPKNLADVDLEALRRQMAETLERAKQHDPRELRAELSRARAELAKLQKAAAAAPPAARKEKRVEVHVLRDPQLARLDKALDRLDQVREKLGLQVGTAIKGVLEALVEVRGEVAKAVRASAPAAIPAVALRPRPIAPAIAHRDVRPDRVAPASDPNDRMGPGEIAVLAALIQFPNGLRREQLGVLTAYKRSSRDAYIQKLRGRGYVDAAGELVLATEAGRAALPDARALPTGEELQRFWLERLPTGEKAVLQVLISAHPNAVDRPTIDERTGYKRSSRDAYLQRLAARELIEDLGVGVRASENLFELGT